MVILVICNTKTGWLPFQLVTYYVWFHSFLWVALTIILSIQLPLIVLPSVCQQTFTNFLQNFYNQCCPKMSKTAICASKLVFCNEKKSILIFKVKFLALFDTSPLHQFNNFLWLCMFTLGIVTWSWKTLLLEIIWL